MLKAIILHTVIPKSDLYINYLNYRFLSFIIFYENSLLYFCSNYIGDFCTFHYAERYKMNLNRRKIIF